MTETELQELKDSFLSSCEIEEKIGFGKNLCLNGILTQNFDECRKYGLEVIKLCEENDFTMTKIELLNIIGTSYAMEENYQKANKLFYEALNTAIVNDYHFEVAQAYANIATNSLNSSNFYNAMDLYIKSLTIFEEIEPTEDKSEDKIMDGRTICYNNISLIYMSLKKYKDALFWLKKAIHKKADMNRESTLMNIGYCYKELNDLQLAMGYFKRAIKVSKETNSNLVLYQCNGFIGDILITKKKYEEALQLFLKSYEYYNKKKLYGNLLKTIQWIGNIYILQEKAELAQPYFYKGLEIEKHVEDEKNLGDFYLIYSKFCFETNNPRDAYLYLTKSNTLHRKINDDNLSQNLAFLSAQFDSEQKEKDLEIYRLKNIELAHAQKTIEQKNENLIKLNEEKDNLLMTISHDLKNYIGATLSAHELLSIREPAWKENKTVKIISDSTKKALHLLKDILYMNKMELDINNIQLTKNDINAAILSTMEDMKLIANRKNIEIQEIYHPKPIYCMINNDKFHRVLNNLIINAIKFTPKDGKITIKTRSEGGFALINIIDTGIGMDKKLITDLFKQYTKSGRKGTDGEESTGLGLSIVKTILNKHNATIDITSEEGKGSDFLIKIPKVD